MISIPDSFELKIKTPAANDIESYKLAVLNDYWICQVSRESSLLGRKEVLGGKAKFGILGDGKEVPQIAMARAFQLGDWRSGYYRDQTFMFALGLSSVEQYFFQLYADAENDPFSGGRQMNSHYATPLIGSDGAWLDQTKMHNVSSDISCTAGQMARSLGIAMASRIYRNVEISASGSFSDKGNEISFVTIGDSSTSEGVFWETLNAAAVMKVPLLTAVWDDGYGISVPVEMQTTKGSISKALEGLRHDGNKDGILIYTVKGWDYAELCAVFEKTALQVRNEHIPALIHVQELTQPQGHSTSGSHERYKSPERLEWEKENDCIKRMGEWMVANQIATQEELANIREHAAEFAKNGRDNAWKTYSGKTRAKMGVLSGIYASLESSIKTGTIKQLETELSTAVHPTFSDVVSNARKLKIQLLRFNGMSIPALDLFVEENMTLGNNRYHTHLHSETPFAAIHVKEVPAKITASAPVVSGFQVLNTYFDKLFSENNTVVAFGEDVGRIGDVNQGFAGLQLKYGTERIFDTGIREWTIMGQALGASMRGLRTIAEIQYLDYMAYAFSLLTDDLATLRYRSNGIQRAPAIVRTRGHRLEGIWHAGSPMGMIISSMQGIYLCVPRNMVQAVGFYNTLLASDDPGIIVECLNGYRLKETMPENLLEYTIPLGVPEILTEGSDITLVTYGSCVREAQKATEVLKGFNISVELIDVRTLMPFDVKGMILQSLKKTNRILFMDEDIPGGATSFMMREVLETWNGYSYLDAKPVTLTAAAHRPPFGSDGDYFSKPHADDVVDVVLKMMRES